MPDNQMTAPATGPVWSLPDGLLVFVEREGHANVPSKHVEPDGFRLGTWVATRRDEYRRGRLSQDRIAALEAVPGWCWNVHDARWERGLAALRRFVEREGHAQVPHHHVEPNGFKLGTWVRRLRYSSFEVGWTKKRIADLEAVPGWSWTAQSVSTQFQPNPANHEDDLIA
ncbi:helicase associated domain-containing protein [Acidocella aminolytica]|uniref:Helicase n=1 Tax=Acidocella aminolytica 101 = DSM 11237 TaxID=1120923 RepID=A0A0D6PF84_9PROT|nr:helicase associated domain-containing protein [Acidocella aminolytica]GAN80410.1 helicase [Acidocella aminolytica 101 = DSM 11237]GBQ36268.1 hypothetical protein AA11237_1197 [Acidocella aminolytica 101 = DSM 11237]SHF45004.1 Helicase associated domain-containing protein [Acidocella aminolytica 101 = DSM 11237]